MNIPSVEVQYFDTTLRDGAQSLPKENQFKTGDKPEIAHHIASLGASVIEAGFPATPGDQKEVEQVAKTVGRQKFIVDEWQDGARIGQSYQEPIIAGLARAVPGDLEATWAAVHKAASPRIHTFISTDNEHMQAKFPGKSPKEVRRIGVAAVKTARELMADTPNGTVEFSAEAASTTNQKYLETIVKSTIEAGADVFNAPDTVGQCNPKQMRRLYKQVLTWAIATNPDVIVSAHTHNDLGMATANSLALVEAAAWVARKYDQKVRVQIEATIAGLGEDWAVLPRTDYCRVSSCCAR
jgi:2-isopropylmalate synthase